MVAATICARRATVVTDRRSMGVTCMGKLYSGQVIANTEYDPRLFAVGQSPVPATVLPGTNRERPGLREVLAVAGRATPWW